jgi:hypothetical protein
VPATRRRQAARVLVDEVLGRFQRANVYCVLIDLLDSFAHALRRFQIAAILGPMQASDDFRWQDHVDRLVADPRKDVDFHVPDDLLGVVVRPLPVFPGIGAPGSGQQFEGVQAGDGACSSFCSRTSFGFWP